MPAVARLGDACSHGGGIGSASSTTFANGIGVARNNDSYPCPLHGLQVVLSSRVETADGRSIVCVGDSTSCSAVVTQGSPNVNAG